jgi:serine/threonine-protein kinase
LPLPAINPARWAELAPHIDALLTLPPLDRARALDELAANEPETASQLRALLDLRDAASQAAFLGGVADPSVLPPGVAAGDTLGAWTLVDVIGEGGMGSVWRARRSDGRFEGEAAIKLLRSGLFDPVAQERFRREGAMLARLRHPGIAQLLDAGISGRGQPYLVLELVQGEHIDAWCEARGLGLRERVELFCQVLDAVALAHSQLVIHRDLKPSNILVDAAGRVKLLDFGIARLQGDDANPGLTREGAFALTPQYAAPEQFNGGVLSTATDVYALGVVLFGLLTGAHPSGLAQAAPLEYVRAASDGAVRQASDMVDEAARRRALRGDLDNILAKALRPSADERYPSVAALADDLRRTLRHEPVAAHAPGWRYRTVKLLQRRPIESGLVTVLLLAIGAGMTATLWQWRRAEAERTAAESSMVRATAANQFTATLLTEAANVGHPLSFKEILDRGEKIALAQGSDARQQAYALLTLAQFHSTDGDHETSARQAAQAAAAARQSGDRALAAAAQCVQGMAVAYSVDAKQGEKLAADALADPALDRQGRITCLNQLGLIAMIMRDGAKALDFNERALALMKASPLQSASQLSAMLNDIGEAHRVLGHYREATDHYGRALEMLHRIGLGDSSDAASILNQWAVLESDTGQALQAIERFTQAIRIEASVLGPQGVSAAKRLNLARTLIQVNRLDEALESAQLGLARAGQGGNRPALLAGQQTMFNIRRLQGRYDQAQTHLDAAFELLKGSPPHSPMGVAIEVGQAQLERALGRPQRALEWLARARADLDKLTERVGGRPAEGLPVARDAVAIARQMQHGAPASGDTGRTLLTLAKLEAATDGPAAAAATARLALENLLPSVGPDSPRTRAARALAEAAPRS